MKRVNTSVLIMLFVMSSPSLLSSQMVWTLATDNAGWSARQEHSSVVFNNEMWVLGGHVRPSPVFNDVWHSPDGVNWTLATDSAGWEPRSGHTSVVFDNKMWVMGGWAADDVWYSSDGVNWTLATDSPGWDARGEHTSVVFDNKMWVMGGMEMPPYNDVWYSTDGINWTYATNAEWNPRANHSSVVYDGKIWVMGGGYGLALYYNDVWYSVGLGIEENESHTQTQFSGITIFNGPLQLPQGKSCRVFDITGRVVKPARLKPGIYFIEVDGKVTQKVIKVR